jgi:excisionase family DNA binding protein
MNNTGDERRSLTTAGEEKAWIGYSQAQQFCGLGRTKLWELVSAGEVEAAKIGRSVRISRRSLDDFMRRNSYVESKR